MKWFCALGWHRWRIHWEWVSVPLTAWGRPMSFNANVRRPYRECRRCSLREYAPTPEATIEGWIAS